MAVEQPELKSVPTVAPAPELPPEPASVFLESLKAAAVVDGPVDRVGLADNLYALGELSIALEMYQKVDTTELSASERYWVAFQRASCHRRLGQVPEAQELYRRIAGQQSAGWLATTSRWWLDQIDLRRELREKLDGHAEIFQKVASMFPKDQPDDDVPKPQPGI